MLRMKERSLICKECEKHVANTRNVLSRHIRSVHGIEWPDYYVKHEMAGVWPTCACGCGSRLEWHKGGFGKYIAGHDVRAQTSVVREHLRPGWITNPFTGREENIMSDAAIAFMEHCIDKNDPVTSDHGFRVGWEDSKGSVKFLIPTFKHIKKKLILIIDECVDLDFNRRVIGLKQWCDMHQHSMLVIRPTKGGFDVVSGYRPKGITDA